MPIQPVSTFVTNYMDKTDLVDKQANECVRELLKAGVAASNIKVTPQLVSSSHATSTAFIYVVTVVAVDAKVR